MRTLLEIGTRVYNHGDMANQSHFGTITDIKTSKWGTDYQITPDADSSDRNAYWVTAVIFSSEYRGNGMTRLVTEAAYRAWREAEMAKLRQIATR